MTVNTPASGAARVDALIIGAGPAGTTAATLLAQQGLTVWLVERDAFPRFRIGESLLPGGNAILKRLGIWDKMDDAGFLRKYGAEFVSSDGKSRVHNVFADGLIKDLDYAYQVERSRFDKLLLDNAVAAGAVLQQPCRVISVKERVGENEQNGWHVTLDNGTQRLEVETDWLLDASGRTAFLGRRLKLTEDEIPYPKRFAVYNHFHSVKRAPGPQGNNIIVTRLRDGWFWAIPLDEKKTSVGVVSTRKREEWKDPNFTPEVFFDNEVQRGEFLRELLENATPLDDFRVTADYTYSFSHFGGPRHLLLGDAACFIDPIFSSGVYIAMRSAEMAADAVLQARQEKRSLSAADTRRYTRRLKSNVRTMRRLIEVYYHQQGYAVFMSPTDRLQLFQAVNSIVAGNSKPGFAVSWRFRLFLLVCWLNRYFNMVPGQRLQ